MIDTINQLNAFMEASGFSQTRVAKACGISSATLSYYIKGTYTGDIDAVTAKIKDFLAIEKSRENLMIKDESIVPTSAYKTIFKFCDLVLTHKVVGMLTAEAGTGKTTALKEFAKQHSAVIMIEADHGYTARALFDELCSTLGLDDRGSLHQKLVRVVEKLNGSSRMIIIDEAEHLPYRALELIRRVHDKAGISLALCGTPRLEKNVQGDRNHYRQLNSRVSAPCRAPDLTDNDTALYLNSRFNSCDPDVVKYAARISKQNFRLLSHLVRWSGELMRKNSITELTKEVIEQASSMLTVAR